MFKDKLRKLREENGLSQYELADKIYVSRSAIAKWENGFGMPGKESLEILCEFFNVTKEYLLEEDEPIKIIENVNRRSRKKILLLSLLLLPLTLYLCISIGVFINHEIRESHFPTQGSFYSTKYLKKFGLKDLEKIEPAYYSSGGSLSPYLSAEIDSYEVFDNYVNYVYNKLLSSSNYSFVGYSVTILPGRAEYNNFLMKSFDLSNHIVRSDKKDGKATEYIFYFITEKDYSKALKDPTKINYLKISYQYSYSYKNNEEYEENSQCKMELRKCLERDKLAENCIIHENYFIFKTLLTNDNIDLYLNVKVGWRTIEFSSKHYSFAYDNKIYGAPYDIFIKVKYTLTPTVEYSKLGTKSFVRYYTLQQFDTFTITDYDIGGDDSNTSELEKYNIQIEYEVLENSYYYSLTYDN